MNLRGKKYIENQKKAAEAKLKARLAYLQEKGLEAESIQRDPTVRRIRALIRKADSRLAKIAAEEKLIRERAQAKVEKLAAEKAAREKPEKEVEKPAPEKKEKRGKKEKSEKKEKGAPKKVKEEAKKENEETP